MPLDESDINLILGKVNESLNAAITNHTKRLQKDFESRLESMKPADPPPKAPEAPEAPKGGKADPMVSILQAKLEEMEKNFKTEKQGREEAEKRRRDESAFVSLQSSLAGVNPSLQEAAAKLLFHVEKRVKFDEMGNPLFVMKNAEGQDVEYELKTGVEQWKKSKDAEAFMPPPSQPNGGRGGRAPVSTATKMINGVPQYEGPATTDHEKAARAAEQTQAIQALLDKGLL